MKNYLLLIITLLTPSICHAASTINFLNIEGDTLYFSTNEAKTVTSPECVAVVTNNRWAVSLDSQSGQIIYASLLTAVANQIPIEVQSAGDCKDANGIERAKSVALISE